MRSALAVAVRGGRHRRVAPSKKRTEKEKAEQEKAGQEGSWSLQVKVRLDTRHAIKALCLRREQETGRHVTVQEVVQELLDKALASKD